MKIANCKLKTLKMAKSQLFFILQFEIFILQFSMFSIFYPLSSIPQSADSFRARSATSVFEKPSARIEPIEPGHCHQCPIESGFNIRNVDRISNRGLRRISADCLERSLNGHQLQLDTKLTQIRQRHSCPRFFLDEFLHHLRGNRSIERRIWITQQRGHIVARWTHPRVL